MRKVFANQKSGDKTQDDAKDVQMTTEEANMTTTGPFTSSNKLTASYALDGNRSGTRATSLAAIMGG